MYVFRIFETTIHQERSFRRFLSITASATLILILLTNFLRFLGGNLDRSYPFYILDLAFFAWTCGTLTYIYWRQKCDPLKIRIILTKRQIAIKRPGRPMIIINRRDCTAYGPLKDVLSLKDGSEYSLQKLPIPQTISHELARFIFTHWWPELSPKHAEVEMRKQTPSVGRQPEVLVAPAVVLFYMLLSYVVSADIGESIMIPFFCVPALAISIFWASRNLWKATKVYRARRAYRFDLTRGFSANCPEVFTGTRASDKMGHHT